MLIIDGEEERVGGKKKGRGRKRGVERDSCLTLTPAGWVLADGTALETAPSPLPSQRCLARAIFLFFGRMAENPPAPGASLPGNWPRMVSLCWEQQMELPRGVSGL